MAPSTPRLKTLAVGGNPVSAFLSWRLQATNACDVTLVWKSAYDHVAQYGISFKSPVFGNERFKPRHVVRTPEDAASNGGTFDYVILCIKALPDVYDLAAVIDSVVRPHHTCIIVNTTHALGVESAIEERFPTNVVLSLVSGAELSQLNQSEFEHRGSTEIWIGPANANKNIPAAIQEDMAQALAMTLSGAQVDCKVSSNIRQQQYERVIGPIAFHPASVIFETPNHAALMEKVGVSQLVADVIDELLALAAAQGCKFSEEFKQMTIEEMTQPATHDSIMYQDYIARRPMEVETYLGSPIKLAQTVSVKVPRIETLYAVLFNINLVNRSRPRDAPGPSGSPSAQSPLPPRISSQPGPRGMPNGMPPNGNGIPRPRPRGPPMGPMPPGGRRPPMMNGGRPSMNGPPNGYHPPSSRAASRRGSMDGNDMEEFSHLVLYDDIPEAAATNFGPQGGPGRQEFALRERELQLKQRELALRERAMSMGRRPGPPGRRGPPRNAPAFDEEDDEDDYFDPNAGPVAPMIDPDNFDMMSVTSRKNRKIPSATQMRNNPEGSYDNMPSSRSGRFRPSFGRNRSSQSSQMNTIPGLHENILDDPLLGYSSNRYGNVDRGAIQAESRANSLTASRLDDMQYGPGGPGGGMNGPFPRRTSQSPGNMYSPSVRGGRPSPPNGFGPQMNGRPSPEGMRQQPVPRFPPGQANIMAPQQVEQHVGVSLHQSLQTKSTRSLTGSASASAGSGDSARLDSEASAHSSQSSLGPRPPIGVR